MYTYIYMYIYIYRILLNKFVWYTLAIYTTVSLSQTAIFVLPRFHLCTHFSNCTLRKRKRQIKGGRGTKVRMTREKKREIPSRIIILSSRPPSGRPAVLGVHSSADSLPVDRVRRVIRSQGVESAVRRGGERGR